MNTNKLIILSAIFSTLCIILMFGSCTTPKANKTINKTRFDYSYNNLNRKPNCKTQIN